MALPNQVLASRAASVRAAILNFVIDLDPEAHDEEIAALNEMASDIGDFVQRLRAE